MWGFFQSCKGKCEPAGITFSTVLPHLGFVAIAGHPALEEAEGPADFVLLRLDLRRDYVLVPLLVLYPVSVRTFLSAVIIISLVALAHGGLQHLSQTCTLFIKLITSFLILIYLEEPDNQVQWCHAGVKKCPDSHPGPLVYRLLLLTTCLACLEVTMDYSECYL